MSESRIRLQVESGRRDRLLDALGHRRMRRSVSTQIHVDTDDLLLSRHGFALCLCNEDGCWMQALQGDLGAGPGRVSHEVPIDPQGTQADVAQVDVDRHRDSKIGRRLRALLKRHAHPALHETWRVDVTRLNRVLRGRGAVVTWSLDQGELAASGRSQAISELELERESGDPAGLHALAHDWATLHGLWIDPLSKAARGALLARAEPFAAAVKARPPAWSARQARTMDGDALLRRMLASCLAQILPNAAEIARGSRDAEHVHQLRVGMRRLRSIARGMKPFAAAMPAGWEAAIMPLFDALGDARDKHVRSTTLAPRLRAAGAPVADLGGPSEEEGRAIQQLVRGGGFQGVLLRLMACAQAGSEEPARGQAGAGLAHLVRTLDKLARQVTRAARRFDDLPFAHRHEARKRLKRLRYLAEFAAPAFDGAAVRAWLDRIAAAQACLGTHIDLALACDRFAAAATTNPGAGYAAGWLRAQADASAGAARRSLQRLCEARCFWSLAQAHKRGR